MTVSQDNSAGAVTEYVTIMIGDSRISAITATSLSNSHLKTRFQSEMGRSTMSNTGTSPT